ncbi:hypothetical protein Tco_1057398 [Tanacetum coccineum]|uniref:Uncharacterized protein n=1 Tax=Tanacetum coccineum TaxID=301880 RepID=A0ABQ5H5I7_9ASTR
MEDISMYVALLVRWEATVLYWVSCYYKLVRGYHVYGIDVGVHWKTLGLTHDDTCWDVATTNSMDLLITTSLIIEQRVKVNQKARILELKRINHEKHCSDNLYAISLKEDTTYPCPKLHSASMKERSIRRIQMKPYAVFKYKSWNTLEYNNHGAYAKKRQYTVLISIRRID